MVATPNDGSSDGAPVTSNTVVAVNTAILPEFGGSNLGVPAEKVIELLKQAGLR